MQNLINTVKKIENILCSLEILLKQEYDILSNQINLHKDLLILIIEKKTKLFKKYFFLNKERLSLEKRYNVFSPYLNNQKLNYFWNKIVKKCLLLKKINLRNKILINKKLYLNQYFLELFLPYKTAITYNSKGNFKI